MNSNEQFEQQLQQQYQHDKACHVLPAHIRSTVLKQAKDRKRRNWHGLWRNTQLALSCALVLILGYLLLPAPRQPQWHYQIVFSTDTQYRQIQHHGVTSQPESVNRAVGDPATNAYQQYLTSQQRDNAFYRQTGLLHTEAEQWQIRVCNELLLTIDKQLLGHIQLSPDITLPGRQWVEFLSDANGQLIAIKPSSKALHCPHS